MKKRVGNSTKTVVSSIAIGIVFMISFSIVICLILSALLITGHLTENQITFACLMGCFLASLIGTFVAGKRTGRKYAIVCLCTSTSYFVILTMVTIAISHAHFSGIGWGIIACTLGGTISCIMCTMNKRRRRKIK